MPPRLTTEWQQHNHENNCGGSGNRTPKTMTAAWAFAFVSSRARDYLELPSQHFGSDPKRLPSIRATTPPFFKN